MATEDCNLYKTAGAIFQAFRDPVRIAEKYLRAMIRRRGKIAWEIRQVGAPETNYSGILTTAGGLVFLRRDWRWLCRCRCENR